MLPKLKLKFCYQLYSRLLIKKEDKIQIMTLFYNYVCAFEQIANKCTPSNRYKFDIFIFISYAINSYNIYVS